MHMRPLGRQGKLQQVRVYPTLDTTASFPRLLVDKDSLCFISPDNPFTYAILTIFVDILLYILNDNRRSLRKRHTVASNATAREHGLQ